MKITYDDKVGITPKTVHINQVWDDDMNEIKNVVNDVDDRVTALETGDTTPTIAYANWTGTGLIFDVVASSFPVLRTYYSAPNTQITLSPADATLFRYDLIVAKKPTAPATQGTIQVIEGTLASETLVIPPDYDPSEYYLIKTVLIKPAATTPSDPNTGNPFVSELVYANGTGEPTEWTFSSNSGTIVNSGGVIDATNPLSTHKATMKNSTDVVGLNSDKNFSLSFDITLKASLGTSYIFIKLLNSEDNLITNSLLINNGKYGLDSNSLTAQTITIDGSEFDFITLGNVSGIQIYPFKSFAGYYLDNIKFNIGSATNVVSYVGIEEAPIDNKLYGRKNKTWSEVVSNGVVERGNIDAVSGGTVYDAETERFLQSGKNKFNKENALSNTIIQNNTGVFISPAPYGCTNYIKLEPNTTYNITSTYANVNYLHFYDDNFVWISQLGGGSNYSFTTPVNCKYIAAWGVVPSVNFDSWINGIQVEIGNSFTFYESYKECFKSSLYNEDSVISTFDKSNLTKAPISQAISDYIDLTLKDADLVNSGTFDATNNIIPATQKGTSDYIATLRGGEVASGETKSVSGGELFNRTAKQIEINNECLNGAFKEGIDVTISMLYNPTIYDIPNTPQYLLNRGLTRGFKLPYGTNEDYIKNNGISLPKKTDYVKWSYYIYVEAGNYPPTDTRLKAIIFNRPSSNFATETAKIEKIDIGIYKIYGYTKLNVVDEVDEFWIENVWETGQIRPSGDIYITGFSWGYSENNDFKVLENFTELQVLESKIDAFESQIDFLNREGLDKIPSIIENGNFSVGVPKNFERAWFPKIEGVAITETYLNQLGIYYGVSNTTYTGGNIEHYMLMNDDAVANHFQDKNGKYLKQRIYGYTPVPNSLPTLNRLNFTYSDDSGSHSINTSNGISLTQINDNVFVIDVDFLFNSTGIVTSVRLEIIWEEADVPSGGVTVISGYASGFVIKNEDRVRDLNNDWNAKDNSDANKLIIDNLQLNPYNNIGYNRSQIASFLDKYVNKKVDANNQLNVVINGDSIIGRLNGTEISYTPNQELGYFPPNMWQQNISYKLLEMLQWNTSDVQYFNLMASEFTKVGTWLSDLAHQDNIRVYKSNVIGNSFEITITGVKFAKLNWFADYSTGANFDVLINGVTPSSLGVIGVDELQTTLSKNLKWGSSVWSGLNPLTTYTFKFTNNNGSTAYIWGMEFWNNPRINVINAGIGGQKAGNHKVELQKFSNDIYNPSLVIHELPAINDSYDDGLSLGGKYPSDALDPSTSTNRFIYALSSGVFTNYSNLELKEGEYATYNGSVWVKGSTTIDSLTNDFNNDIDYLETVAESGIPTILINTHKVVPSSYRPWLNKFISISRTLVNRFGFAFIDMDYNYEVNSLSVDDALSDGVHLNDLGVSRYETVLYEILNPLLKSASANSGYNCKEKKGTVLSGESRTVVFNLPYLEIPTVEVQPYNDGVAPSFMYINSITKSGFVVVGSGAFNWKSKINK